MKVVIVGAGQVGLHIASHLTMEQKDVVVIDTDAEALRLVSDQIDVQTVLGSGSSPVTLEEAGLKEAEIVLAVTNSDETNLVACLMADIISPATKKLARLRNADFDDYHDNFREFAPHVDTVINPEIEVVKTIEQLMRVPGAVDVGELADGRVQFVGVNLDEGARLAGARLTELSDRIGDPTPLIAAIVIAPADAITAIKTFRPDHDAEAPLTTLIELAQINFRLQLSDDVKEENFPRADDSWIGQ